MWVGRLGTRLHQKLVKLSNTDQLYWLTCSVYTYLKLVVVLDVLHALQNSKVSIIADQVFW